MHFQEAIYILQEKTSETGQIQLFPVCHFVSNFWLLNTPYSPL